MHALKMTNKMTDDKFITANQTNGSTRTRISETFFSTHSNQKDIEFLHENCESFSLLNLWMKMVFNISYFVFFLFLQCILSSLFTIFCTVICYLHMHFTDSVFPNRARTTKSNESLFSYCFSFFLQGKVIAIIYIVTSLLRYAQVLYILI